MRFASRRAAAAFATFCLALASAAFSIFGLALAVAAEPPDEKKHEVLVTPADVKWQDGPPALPKGAKVAVLEGDPAREGPFVMRAKLPDGYRIAPHTHPKDERV